MLEPVINATTITFYPKDDDIGISRNMLSQIRELSRAQRYSMFMQKDCTYYTWNSDKVSHSLQIKQIVDGIRDICKGIEIVFDICITREGQSSKISIEEIDSYKKAKIKPLTKSDLDEIMRVQQLVCDGMEHKEYYYPSERCAFEQWLSDKDNLMLGVWDEHELAAVSCACKNGEFFEEYVATELGRSCDELVCHEVIFVHPKYRGMRLMAQLLKVTEEVCRRKGYKAIWCTVHPDNYFSKRNIIQNEYRFLGSQTISSCGWPRYVMYKML